MSNEDMEVRLKKYLGNYYRCKKKKEQLEERHRNIRADIDSPLGGKGYKEIPSDTSNKRNDGSASLLLRLSEIEDRIEKEKDRMAQRLLEIMDVIDYLPEESDERMVLELRHIDCFEWKDIVKEMNYSRTSCNTYYNKAISKLLEYKRVRLLIDVEEISVA